MLAILKDYIRKQEEKKSYRAFLEEAKANLEAYYVMFQINKLRFFTLTARETVKDLCWPADISEYIRRLEIYNQALKEFKDFEIWYNEDLDRKNQENGRVLHAKKEAAQEQFNGLEPVIKKAVEALDRLC